MKNGIFILIAGVFFTSTPFVGASVIIESLESESARDVILADEGVSVTATAVIRAGHLGPGASGYELGIGNFETLTDFNDINSEVFWNINGDNSFQLSYDTETGTLLMSVTPDGGVIQSVITEPTDWFNQILFSFESGGVEVDFNGTINDEPFEIHNEVSGGQWSGISIALHDNNADNVESFTIVGTIAMSTPLPALGGDQFRGDWQLVKNSAIVPESSTVALVIASFALLVVVGRRRK